MTETLDSSAYGSLLHEVQDLLAPDTVLRGEVERERVQPVVDGDTLVVTVDLGFGVEVDQTLRLRGIDAPELSRQAGGRAREFVCEALSASERVVGVFRVARWRRPGRSTGFGGNWAWACRAPVCGAVSQGANRLGAGWEAWRRG